MKPGIQCVLTPWKPGFIGSGRRPAASGGVQQASGSDVIRLSSATAGIYIRK
jgi:hypothetical protein